MEFFNLTKAAVDGSYGGRDAVFFGARQKGDNRLRARIHLANEQFAAYMRTQAAKRRLVNENETNSVSDQSESSNESEISDEDESRGQLRVTKKHMMDWIKKVSRFRNPRLMC
jgi:hypothetical protein